MIYNDNLYFTEYIDQVITYHQRIYQDFSFNYGPFLLYFPVTIEKLLQPMHVGTAGSYFIALTLMQLGGIALLYWTLRALPLSRSVQTVILCTFTVSLISPLMGINYTFVRALLPFSTLLFITRVRQPALVALLFLLGEILQLLVSPELGIAFAAGAGFYGICHFAKRRVWLLFVLPSPFISLIAFRYWMGPEYFTSIRNFSAGSLNLVVEPLPYILFFLFCCVWVVPRMLSMRLEDGLPDAVPLVSLFVVSVGLLPVAFGVCDPLHVFFNGAGIYLLAAVACESFSRPSRNYWLSALFLVVLWTQCVNFSIYLRPLHFAVDTVIDMNGGRGTPNPILADMPAIESLAKNSKISIPFLVPFAAEQELKRTNLYQIDRLCFQIGRSDAAEESARIARMKKTEWVLLPTISGIDRATTETTAMLIGLGLTYPDRQEPYISGAGIYRDIVEHWTPEFASDTWVLYHNKSFQVTYMSKQPTQPN